MVKLCEWTVRVSHFLDLVAVAGEDVPTWIITPEISYGNQYPTIPIAITRFSLFVKLVRLPVGLFVITPSKTFVFSDQHLYSSHASPARSRCKLSKTRISDVSLPNNRFLAARHRCTRSVPYIRNSPALSIPEFFDQ